MVGYGAAQHYAKIRFSPNAAKYNRPIQQHALSVMAGSDFPDLGYAASDLPLPGLTHDVGKAAHWPPFHAGAAQYIRSRPDFHTAEWGAETQKLVAVAFGTAVHYITDEAWEGLTDQLGRGQGMVRFVSSLNLGHPGRSDNDEGPANMTADFVRTQQAMMLATASIPEGSLTDCLLPPGHIVAHERDGHRAVAARVRVRSHRRDLQGPDADKVPMLTPVPKGKDSHGNYCTPM